MTRVDPLQQLTNHYQDWLEVARAENQIIREMKFEKLADHAEKKELLMATISEAEKTLSSSHAEHPAELRMLIHQVSDMEGLNLDLLQERMKELNIQKTDLERRKQAAKQLRSKYSS
jgi:hypothetical protein